MKIDKKNWKKVKLGDVVTYKKITVDPETSGLDRYIAGEHMNTEDLHLRKWGTVGDGYLGPAFHSKFEKGDILYGSRRTYLKKVAVADFDGITSNTTFVLKENTDKVIPGLIPFMMLSDSFTEHSVKNSKGSVNPYINFKDIGKYEFLLPPKEQQTKLAELLWAGDDVVERYSNLNMKLRKLWSINISNLYKNKLTPLSNTLKPKKKISNSPHVLNQYIGLENIKSGEFSIEKYSESAIAEANCFVFEKGDLLYSKLRPYLDKAVIVDGSGVCSTELLVYDTVDSDKEYILNILHSQEFIKFVNNKSFGTKMPRVSNEIVGQFNAYLPSHKEQIILKNKLNTIRNLETLYFQQSIKSKQIQKQLINQIFG